MNKYEDAASCMWDHVEAHKHYQDNTYLSVKWEDATVQQRRLYIDFAHIAEVRFEEIRRAY